MTKIDIVSGFLGAGKTTLIQKLLKEALHDTKVVLIENEFGEIGIDGGFLKESGVEMKEMNSGCICCSLVGDFGASLQEVLSTYAPERILIEPSGVGKLSDVIRAVQNVKTDVEVSLSSAVVVVDASKCKMYAKNFGEFFLNQIENAGLIILSRTGAISEEKTAKAVEIIREHNQKAQIITTPWEEITGMQILKAMEEKNDWMEELLSEIKEAHEHHHHHDEDEHEHHHHHDHDEDDDHDEHEHHHHDHDDHDHCCCGHHHDHDDDDDEDEHEHHHDHDGHCCCGHHHHHDHDADEVFTSWGVETARKFTKAEVEHALTELDTGNYGMILRSKGIVNGGADGWLEFDYVPGEWEVRARGADVGGKLVVIGSKLNEKAIAQLFGC